MSSGNESGACARVYIVEINHIQESPAGGRGARGENSKTLPPPPHQPFTCQIRVSYVVSHLHRSYVNSIYFTEHTLRHTLTLFTSIYFTSCGTTSWRSEECGYRK